MSNKAFLLLLLLFASPSVMAIDCPAGSHPWTDSWGNPICQSFESGNTTSIQGSTSNCPAGTHPWTDSWGNPICQSFDSKQEFHDTSKGCPTGTHPWTDSWGNPVCQEF